MKLQDVKDYLKESMKENLDEAKHHQYLNSVFYTSENDGLKKALDKIEEYEKSKPKITDISYDSRKIRGGCDTCDYGSEYIKDMYITYDETIKIHFHITVKIEDYGITESDWMMAVLNSDTMEELIEWYKSKTIPIVREEWTWKNSRHNECDIYYEIEDTSQEGVSIIRHYIGVDSK